ncbi:endonuclease MutS2 [Xylanibacter muris]|uniref:Endonuclease MutS2 n=1 Tax=Xylanibacter muris TaxID=2736290 RepID=A0ABX2ANC0_9BACT|nr:Smr/MutS family protein [Xylanibacter muris]NPD92689.1 endonuclease MutS2 [Xylanibacter muris]
MIYPNNFESKIGFNEIKTLLKQKCISNLGREMVDKISFCDKWETVNEWLLQIKEFRLLQQENDNLPLQYFFDVREAVGRLRLEGTHLEENELFDLRRSLETIMGIVNLLNISDDVEEHTSGQDIKEKRYPYPALHRLSENVMTFPLIIRRIDQILDKFGKIKDNASPELMSIRRELSHTESGISRTLYNILRTAQSDGLVDKDAAPTIRDGRLVIPVAPGLKRKIRGIVHDESASGKTVFIEPTEVVEANNKVRELEAEEHREIIRILSEFATQIRPHVKDILYSYRFLAIIDMIRAKTEFANMTKAIEPRLEKYPYIDWIQAEHPLLKLALDKQEKSIVPLDVTLTKEKRIIIISGPNAGGKSVCLKTVGLLQYMLQCGLSIPVNEHSKTGIFKSIMIDIGDEQSIENDLSTYSSHLTNMKNMMKQANMHTLLLIDEFGGGTEPQIGGAIAEAVLKQFCNKEAFGVITTHYQNLKHFAEDNTGVVNGAMLYDRHEMRPLFQLAIGQPGSSFAIEIARKTGIPEEVIRDASEIVGSDYIQSDKYLQDIVRDKRYWENKRQTIHQHEKSLEQKIERYEAEIKELEQNRKNILRKAKEQAEELLKESNRKIENTIREIRKNQAEKEETKRIREELKLFKDEINDIDSKANDEIIARKIKQIQERKERKEKRRKEKSEREKKQAAEKTSSASARTTTEVLKKGDTVRIKGLTSIGYIEETDGKMATVIFGDMRTKMKTERLEIADKPKQETARLNTVSAAERHTRETIDNRKLNFKQDLDVRGMRGEEAINAVTYFIDDAILVGMSRVRILHGTGSGILRQLIRQYLATIPNITSFKDEHVQFGGTGITVVDIG